MNNNRRWKILPGWIIEVLSCTLRHLRISIILIQEEEKIVTWEGCILGFLKWLPFRVWSQIFQQGMWVELLERRCESGVNRFFEEVPDLVQGDGWIGEDFVTGKPLVV